MGLVVRISGRWQVGQPLHIIHPGNEQGVCAKIQDLLHCSAEKTVCSDRDIIQTVGRPPTRLIPAKLVRFSSGLEPEVFKRIEAGRFAEDGQVKLSTFSYQIMGKVGLVYRDADAVWLAGHLARCVRTAILLGLGVSE